MRTYTEATEEVIKFLNDKGINSLLSSLNDDTDGNGNVIYRWSVISNGVDYSIEYYTDNNEIDFYDCLNA